MTRLCLSSVTLNLFAIFLLFRSAPWPAQWRAPQRKGEESGRGARLLHGAVTSAGARHAPAPLSCQVDDTRRGLCRRIYQLLRQLFSRYTKQRAELGSFGGTAERMHGKRAPPLLLTGVDASPVLYIESAKISMRRAVCMRVGISSNLRIDLFLLRKR